MITSKSKRVSVGIFLDDEVYKHLKAKAESEGRSLSNYIRRYIVPKGVYTPKKELSR